MMTHNETPDDFIDYCVRWSLIVDQTHAHWLKNDGVRNLIRRGFEIIILQEWNTKKMIKNFQFHRVQKTTLMEYTYSFCCCCGGHIKKLKAHITRYIKCPAEWLTDWLTNDEYIDGWPQPPTTQHSHDSDFGAAIVYKYARSWPAIMIINKATTGYFYYYHRELQ